MGKVIECLLLLRCEIAVLISTDKLLNNWQTFLLYESALLLYVTQLVISSDRFLFCFHLALHNVDHAWFIGARRLGHGRFAPSLIDS